VCDSCEATEIVTGVLNDLIRGGTGCYCEPDAYRSGQLALFELLPDESTEDDDAKGETGQLALFEVEPCEKRYVDAPSWPIVEPK
jgi:hypothetical protein